MSKRLWTWMKDNESTFDRLVMRGKKRYVVFERLHKNLKIKRLYFGGNCLGHAVRKARLLRRFGRISGKLMIHGDGYITNVAYIN